MVSVEFPVPAEIERLLDRRLVADSARMEGRCRVTGPLLRSEESVIYRATCPGLPYPLLIKHPSENGSPARHQYELLRIAAARFEGRSGLSVPRAYPHLLDDGFVITEWIEAPTLGQILNSLNVPLARVVSALDLAGRWLRVFHGDHDAELVCLDPDRMLGEVRTAMARPVRRGISRRFARSLDLLERNKPMLARIPVPIGSRHGDFKPDNVMIQGDCAVGIDLTGNSKDPVILDIAYFLHHLDMQLIHSVAGWRLWPLRRALRSAFLRGYGRDWSAAQECLLAWVELQATLRIAHNRIGRARNATRKGLLGICCAISAHLCTREFRRMSAHQAKSRLPQQPVSQLHDLTNSCS
jgi:hypothetical protein